MRTPIWNLICLRYRLLWSRARTSRGRATFAILAYAVLLAAGFLQAAGGFALASLAASIDRSREVTTVVFSALGLIAAASALGFGLGTQRVFSEERLRRFPLTRTQRFAAQFLIGILDPVWLTISAAAFGLALGFCAAGVQALGPALGAAALFVVACYFLVSGVVAIAERWMRSAPGAISVSVIALLFAGLIATGVAVGGRGAAYPIAQWPGIAMPLLPGGLAATLMTQPDGPSRILSVLGLSGWAILGSAVLAATSRRETRKASSTRRPFDGGYRLLAHLAGRGHDPLLDKALRYHWRCSRLRFNAILAVPLIPAMTVMTGHHSGDAGGYFIGLSLLFLSGLLSTSSVTLNQFGYDGPGVLRYALLPQQPEDALRAGMKASILIGGCVATAALTIWLLLFGSRVGMRLSLAAALAAAGGVPAFAAVGMWVSVFAPRRASMKGLVGSPLSGAGILIQAGAVAAAFIVAFLLSEWVPLAAAERFWWLSALLPVGGTFLYWSSCRVFDRVRDRIRFGVFPQIAWGAD